MSNKITETRGASEIEIEFFVHIAAVAVRAIVKISGKIDDACAYVRTENLGVFGAKPGTAALVGRVSFSVEKWATIAPIVAQVERDCAAAKRVIEDKRLDDGGAPMHLIAARSAIHSKIYNDAYPGSKKWFASRDAEKELAEFDIANPIVVEAAARESKTRYDQSFVAMGCD